MNEAGVTVMKPGRNLMRFVSQTPPGLRLNVGHPSKVPHGEFDPLNHDTEAGPIVLYKTTTPVAVKGTLFHFAYDGRV